MDMPSTGLPITKKSYPISLKYHILLDEEIHLLEYAGCISNSLIPRVAPGPVVPTKLDPLHPEKHQLHLV